MASSRHTLPPSEKLPLFSISPIPSIAPDFVAESAPLLPDRRKDVLNGRLLKGLTVVRPYGIPLIEPCTAVPGQVTAFSEALALRNPDPEVWVHFFEDDYKLERFWRQPEKYLQRLRGFAGIIGPDFSLYENMPVAQQIGNTYRNQLLAAWVQHQGVPVIPNVRLSGVESVSYALAGVPKRSTIALGLHGCTKDLSNRSHVIEEMRIVCAQLDPLNVLIYGSESYDVAKPASEVGIPVHVFTPDTWKRSRERKAA